MLKAIVVARSAAHSIQILRNDRMVSIWQRKPIQLDVSVVAGGCPHAQADKGSTTSILFHGGEISDDDIRPRDRIRHVRIFGIGPDEPVADFDFTPHTPPWAQDRYVHETRPALRDRGIWSGEFAYFHDGFEVPVSALFLAHHDSEGKIEFVSSVTRDIILPVVSMEGFTPKQAGGKRTLFGSHA